MAIVELKFEYVESKKESGGEVLKDKDGNIVYERNDMVALEVILSLVDTQKCKQPKWMQLLSIHDKVREQCRLKNYNQTLDFSVDEISTLNDLINDINGHIRKDYALNMFHLMTWRSIKEQLKAGRDKDKKDA